MDGTHLADLLDLYIFPPGRVVFAAEQVAALAADDQALRRIFAAANRSAELARAQMDLETRWKAGRSVTEAVHTEAAHDLNDTIDPLLAALHKVVVGIGSAFPAGSPRAVQADRFLTATMPTGPRNLMNASFEEQLVGVDLLLTLARGELADAVATLGIGDIIERLAGLNARFATEVRGRADDDAPTWDEVLQARHRTREGLAAMVVTVCGEFAGSSPETVAQRVRLLRPVLDQNAAIQAQRRRKNTAVDIDPDADAGPSTPIPAPAPPEPQLEPAD